MDLENKAGSSSSSWVQASMQVTNIMKKRSKEDEGWSGLLGDLLAKIKQLLPLPDMLRFSCVCNNWRPVAKLHHRGFLPWLIVPSSAMEAANNDDGTVLGFYSISDEKIYKVEVPELFGWRISGASSGWLIIVHPSMEVQLLHPFTRRVLMLPSLARVRIAFPLPNGSIGYEYYLCRDPGETDFHIYKSIVAPQPDGHPVVVAISADYGELFFCREGIVAWTKVIDADSKLYSDLAFFNGDLYALTVTREIYLVKGLDGRSLPTASLFASFPHGRKPPKENSYLVASAHELLQVVRFLDRKVKGMAVNITPTRRFKVYRLEIGDRKWVQVTNLGNSALFVGLNQSCSVVASDFLGCKRNCIYFTDDRGFLGGRNVTGHDKGVFNLDDGNIEKICAINSIVLSPLPVWYSTHP